MDEQRQMVQGDWKCAGCGAAITELPFEPDGTRELFCRDCFRQKRNEGRPPRQMISGNWTCSGCGTAITELPFDPGDKPVQCKQCYLNSKNS